MKSKATPSKVGGSAASSSGGGIQDSSTKMIYSPYQITNTYKEYVPLVKRRPESTVKQREKIAAVVQEWNS